MSVLPDAAPLAKLNAATPRELLLGPPTSEICPLGVPVPVCGFTEAVKFTACPCVSVVGVKLLRVVTEGASVTKLHFVTRLLASTDPSPVARSYPVVVLYPLSTP